MKHLISYALVLVAVLAGLAAIYLPYVQSPWHGVTHGWESVFILLFHLSLAVACVVAALVLTFSRPRSRFKWPLWLAALGLFLSALPLVHTATAMKDRSHFVGTPREEDVSVTPER